MTDELDRLVKILNTINQKKTVLRSLDPQSLKPWRYYSREDADEVAAMAQKMREEDYRQEYPVTVDLSTGEVIVGVIRLLAAQAAGIKEIPCICYDRLELDERVVLASDNALKQLKKSPMSMVNQLQELHLRFGFSYREIEKMLGISRAEIGRKLKVPETSEGIQRLYAQRRIGDTAIEHIAKEVQVRHQEAFAQKLAEIRKKISKLHFDKLIIGYRHALQQLASDPDADQDVIKIPSVTKEEVQQELLKENFPAELKRFRRTLRQLDFSWNNNPENDIADLQSLYDAAREALRQYCSRHGKAPRAISQEQETKLLIEQDMKSRPARAAKTTPTQIIQFKEPSVISTSSASYDSEQAQPAKAKDASKHQSKRKGRAKPALGAAEPGYAHPLFICKETTSEPDEESEDPIYYVDPPKDSFEKAFASASFCKGRAALPVEAAEAEAHEEGRNE